MEHYYTNKPSSESNKKIFKTKVFNKEYSFYSDSGVFSIGELDFGSRLLIETVPQLSGSVLDIGCGYGPIGIILKDNNNIDVTMADVNERAVELARENSKVNNVDINVIQSDMYSNVDEKYNYIVTNPPIRIGKIKLLEFLIGAKKHLAENGELWFVIRKQQGALSIAKLLENEYNIEIVEKRKGFCIIRAFALDL